MIFTGIRSTRSVHHPLVPERLHEPAVGERRQDFRRDSTTDEHACSGYRAQRRVARFGSVRVDEDFQRLDTGRTSTFERSLGDPAGAPGSSGSMPASHAVRMSGAVQVRQAAARHHMFDFGAAVARDEQAEHRDVAFGSRQPSRRDRLRTATG